MQQPRSYTIPQNIKDIRNRIFFLFSFRDIAALFISLGVGASIGYAFMPLGWFAFFLGGIFSIMSLYASFMHIFNRDMMPIEKMFPIWLDFFLAEKTMVWKKEYAPSGEYLKDATQSMLLFTIDEDGILLFDGEGQGGAMLLKVNGVDYEMLSIEEQDVVASTFGSMLDTLKFPVQLLVKSGRPDMRPYIEEALAIAKDAAMRGDEKIKSAAIDYAAFLDAYQEADEVFEKAMYMIIPYNPESERAGNASLGYMNVAVGGGFVPKKSRKGKGKKQKKIDIASLQGESGFNKETTRRVLKERAAQAIQFLKSMPGVSAYVAAQHEYVELFYYYFNLNESIIREILDRTSMIGKKIESIASYGPQLASVAELKTEATVEIERQASLDELLG